MQSVKSHKFNIFSPLKNTSEDNFTYRMNGTKMQKYQPNENEFCGQIKKGLVTLEETSTIFAS